MLRQHLPKVDLRKRLVVTLTGGAALFFTACNPVATPTVVDGRLGPTATPSAAAASTSAITKLTAPVVTCPQSTLDLRPTWTWTSGGGIGSFHYKLDNGDLTSNAVDITGLSFVPDVDQTITSHTLYLAEQDANQNFGPVGSCTTQILLPVTATATPSPKASAASMLPPRIPIVTGSNPSHSSAPTWTWTSGGGTGNGTFAYKLDSADFATGTATTNLLAFTPFVSLSNGAHTLYVREANSQGTWSDYGSFSMTVAVSTPLSPNVICVSSDNTGRPTWNWTSGGGGGTGSYQYRLDNSDLSTGTTTTGIAALKPNTTLTNSSHTLYVQEKNAMGLWSPTGQCSITVDTSVPGTPVITGLTLFSTPTPTFTLKSGGNGGAGYYQYKFDSSDFSTEALPLVGTTLLAGALADGSHTLYVQERNAVLTWSTSGSFTFAINTAGPNAPVVSGIAFTQNTKPTWTWTPGGGGSGSYRYAFDTVSLTTATPTTALSYTPTTALTNNYHTLYVEECDTAGNWSRFGSKAIVVDNFAPTTGGNGNITAPATTDTTVTLSWSKAQDPSGSNQSDLVYQVYYSATNNLLDATTTVANGTAFGTPATDISSAVVTGLTPYTTYYFTVLVQDQAGNRSAYHQQAVQTLADTIAPVAGATGALTFTNIGSDRFTVNWTAATDDATPQAQLMYAVVYSTSANISTKTNMFAGANGKMAAPPASNITSQTLTELAAGTTYYVNVGVWDSATNLNTAVYTMTAQTTLPFTSGDGTSGSPYIVSNLAELQNAANFPNAYFQLANDIDASSSYSLNNGLGLVPIGNAAAHFTGSFDGNGKTISHLLIATASNSYQGLFGVIDTGAMIKNLAVANAFVQGATYVGGIVGYALGGNLQAVSYQGAVSGSDVGLLVGHNDGATVTDSWAEGAVTGGDNAGGAVGYNAAGGTLEKTYAMANVYTTSTSAVAVGGLVGMNAGAINNSFTVGTIAGNTGSVFGTVNGANAGTMTNVQGFGGPLNAATCSGSGANTGCILEANATWFFNQANAPLLGWDFAGTWIYPDNGRLPVHLFQNHNAAVSFAPEILSGRRISTADKAAYKLWGYCSSNGASINLTFRDHMGGVDTAPATTCLGGIWHATTDLHSAAQGTVTASLTQTIGLTTSTAVTVSLSMQTSFCDGGPAGTFAGGTGVSGDPYTICTLAQLNQIANYLGGGVYFTLMNSLDLSSGFTTLGGTFGGNFDGNGYVLRGSPVPVFNALMSGTISNLNLENLAIVETSASYTGGLARSHVLNQTPTLNNIFATGFVSSAHDQTGGIFGGGFCCGSTITMTNLGSTVFTVGRNDIGGVAGAPEAGAETNMQFTGYVIGLSNVGGLVGANQTATTAYGGVVNAVIMGQDRLAGGYGSNAGNLDHYTVTANVYGNTLTGGWIAGVGNAPLNNIYFSHVNASGFLYSNASGIGGVLMSGGWEHPSVDSSSFTGDIISLGTASGTSGVGGAPTVSRSAFAGNMFSTACAGIVNYCGGATLTNNTVNANFSGVQTTYPHGGICSYAGGGNTTTLTGNVFVGTINGGTTNAGGLIGNYGNYRGGSLLVLTNNHTNVNFNGGTGNGGLVGSHSPGSASTVRYNYSVASGLDSGGGIFGNDNSASGTVDHNFTIALDANGGGGIVGSGSSSAVYGSNYYLSSGGRISTGNAGGNNYGIFPVNNPSQFFSNTNLPESAWDFTTIWKLPNGGGLPLLNWE